jgi:hypothetical protein
MSEERIDVEVTDKVDPNVEKKLRGIANAANSGQSAVSKLKDMLASVNIGPVQQLQNASKSVTATINQELAATSKLRQENDKSATSELKNALAKTKLSKASSDAAISAAKQAQAESRASEASSRAALAALRLADAEAASTARKLKATEASERKRIALDAEAAAAKKVADQAARPIPISGGAGVPQGTGAAIGGQSGSRATVAAQSAAMGANVGTAAQQATRSVETMEVKTVSAFGRMKNAAVNAYDTTRDTLNHWTSGFRKASTDIENSTNKITAAGEAQVATGRKTRSQNANIIAQLQDIGVSLAGGQNPLLVMIQQGSQLSYIATTMDGGVKALTASILRMLAPFAAAAAVVGLLYANFLIWKKEINDDAGIKKYADSLGLTHKEMKKLGDISVTSGDLIKGVWETVKEALNLDGPLSTLKNGVVGAVKFIWDVFKNFAFGMAALFEGGYKTVVTIWNQFPAAFKDIFVQAVNGAVGLLEGLANKTIDVLNALGGNFEHVTLKRMENANAGAAGRMGAEILNNFTSSFRDQEKGFNAFIKRSEENAVKATKERLKKQADLIKADRTPKAGPKPTDPKTQSDYLDDENKKLDNQLSRMKMLKDAREEQMQLDTIEEAFAKRRMPLSAQQLQGFRDRIHAIQEYKYQQAEMDRIYEASVGPARTMNAAIEAATDLYDRGAISLQKYNEELQRATRAYDEATDPLFNNKELMSAAEKASRLYGDALERSNFLEGIRQQLAAQGKSIYDESGKSLNAEVAALVARNDALMQAQYIQGQISGVINPILEDAKFLENKEAMYAEIDRLRQQDVLNERQAQQAKAAIQAKYDEIRFAGAVSFFDALKGLSSSKNKELAAIGKAAAIVDATIKGYQAVQNAYAQVPYPFNIAAAAAMAVSTGVQVANIASQNVGSFATGGQFIVDGQNGIDANNINMNVTRGERVTIETPAQQRANDEKNNGAAPMPALKIVNVTDKKDMHAAMQDSEGERVILNVLRRNPKAIKAITG